jgi:hypothetical protein
VVALLLLLSLLLSSSSVVLKYKELYNTSRRSVWVPYFVSPPLGEEQAENMVLKINGLKPEEATGLRKLHMRSFIIFTFTIYY